MELIIKELKNIEEILLCKVNHKVIGQIPIKCLDNQSVSISEIDSITLTIHKEYTNTQNKTTKINPIYDEILTERFICIDEEYFVIKNVQENRMKNAKTITIYGQEKKIEKNNFVMVNKGLTLFEEDADEVNDIYSFEIDFDVKSEEDVTDSNCSEANNYTWKEYIQDRYENYDGYDGGEVEKVTKAKVKYDIDFDNDTANAIAGLASLGENDLTKDVYFVKYDGSWYLFEM